MTWKKKLSLGIAAVAVAAFFGSVDLRYGDLRYDVAGHSMRHWHLSLGDIKFNAGCAAAPGVMAGGYPCGSSTSGTYTLAGPSSGNFGVASTNFTVTGSETTINAIPSDSSKHGVFSSSAVQLMPQGNTFTYTPYETGSITVSTTNSDSLSNPSGVSYSVANNAPAYPGMGSPWGVNNGGGTLTAASEADPWGGTTGAEFVEGTATSSYQSIASATISAVPSTQIAIFVKQAVAGTNGTPSVELNINDPTFTAGSDVIVTPSTCTVLSTSEWGGASLASSSATTPSTAGSGWCLITMNTTLGSAYTTSVLQVFITEGTTDLIPSGDGTTAVYLYGPVME